jgi:hypothetical protein
MRWCRVLGRPPSAHPAAAALAGVPRICWARNSRTISVPETLEQTNPTHWPLLDECQVACSDDRMRFDIKTKASSKQVLRALTDFTDARLQIWNRTLDPKTYELRDSGQTWAVARESSPRSPFWVVVRYDWSDPESVRWTILDSSYGGGGEGLVQIAPGDAGGSRVHAEWSYTEARRQRLMLFLLQHAPMGRLISRMWASALDRYAESSQR